MSDFRPVPDPSGSRQPPNRRPPTAVGAETPNPEPGRGPQPAYQRPRRTLDNFLGMLIGVPVELAQMVARRVRRRNRR